MPGTTPRPDAATGADRPPSRRASRRAGTVRRASRRRARSRRPLIALCALAAAGSLGAAALLAGAGGGDGKGGGPSAAAGRSAAQSPTQAADSVRRAGGRTTPEPEVSGTAAGKGAKHGPGKSGGGRPDARKGGGAAGNGVFHTARASGKVAGHGTVRRYEVQVEEGTGVTPDEAAREIEGVLADRRGWTADGHDAFQLVSRGAVDFVVKIATPATVDRICGAAGLHTHGEVNCDVGSQVVVNLKRWNQGSPQFSGSLHDYRALIINHEVGHRIGHGHETCPGPGRPAPAMMQQIDGLRGCVANAWPYDSRGNYLSGPAVP
ncbi:DUF3152 domain-containing protein [Streptomyces sp. NPDC006743]|uniref:DUF3152 domain-containing protein n=1 Tax=Streptomyces sp. NPDC006743 TaxID=3154480 RepID=UPI0034516675